MTVRHADIPAMVAQINRALQSIVGHTSAGIGVLFLAQGSNVAATIVGSQVPYTIPDLVASMRGYADALERVHLDGLTGQEAIKRASEQVDQAKVGAKLIEVAYHIAPKR